MSGEVRRYGKHISNFKELAVPEQAGRRMYHVVWNADGAGDVAHHV